MTDEDFGAKVKAEEAAAAKNAKVAAEKAENTSQITPTKRKRPPLPAKMAETMWKPGVSGNPGGRPRSKPITDEYRRILLEEGETMLRAMAKAMLKRALAGNLSAIQEITDRVEGKSTQSISGPDGGPMQVVFGTPEENERRLAELLAKAQDLS